MNTVAVGYVRCSTDEQAQSGLGLAAQRSAVSRLARDKGWQMGSLFADEGVSGSTPPAERPGLSSALESLATLPRSSKGVLVFARTDRLARSVPDLMDLRRIAERSKFALIACDGSVDLTTSHGRAMFGVAGVFAELERDLIRTRTREALAAKKAAGMRLGRPRTMPATLTAQIVELRGGGMSLAGIARRLTDEGVPTVRGGVRWYGSTVQGVLDSVALDAVAS